jgi:hypothetical protein
MTRGLCCETFSENTFGISFLLQTNSGRAFSLEEGGSALPPPLQPLQACLSLVMAASPNQTKQNGGNQTRVSHPLAMLLKACLSLSLYGSKPKPNQTKQNGRTEKSDESSSFVHHYKHASLFPYGS